MSDSDDRWSVTLEGVTLLERYRVGRAIGSGGMATVYEAQDEQLDVPVVVKVPHAAYLAEAGFRERFERETRDLITLQHPHIVSILARGEHEGLPFLVLQYLRGGSLGDRMRREGRLSWSEARSWLSDVARALDFIHQQGVVHRDLKPDNVLFDEHGHAFLSDFGIAKAVGGADTGLTVTGATPGSPAYMAPEQPRQIRLTGASDQYALAATVYEALSGRPTHEGETAVDVLLKKQTEMPPPLAALAPDVPAAVSDAVMRALAREPEARFETCGAMVAAMEASDAPTAPAAAPAPTPVPVPTTPLPTAPAAEPRAAVGHTLTLSGASRRTVWLVLTACVLAVPLALVVSGAFERDEMAADGGSDMASAPAPPSGEELGTPPAVEAALPAWAQDLVGTWVVDEALLEQRLRDLRPPRKGSARKLPRREELEWALKSRLNLVIGADGRFVVHARARRRVGMERVEGRWRAEDDILLFTPDAPAGDVERKAARETFIGRPVDGNLMLERMGASVILKKQ